MRKISVKLAVLVGVAAITGGLLVGCSAKAYPDQCALIVGSGGGDNHKVKKVIEPGDKVEKGDDHAFYLPCGDRNFRVTDHDGGDDANPITATTGSGRNGEPALPVKLTLNVYFTLNEDKDALTEFWSALCRKYNCASTKADQGDQSKSNYATPGWNGMLRENFPDALNRAAQKAVEQFGPTLWQQQGQADWPKVAAAMSKDFMDEIKLPTNSTKDFFCGTGSDFSKGKCNPIGISVQSVQPTDPSVKSIYNQGIAQDQQQTLNQKRVDQAKKLYGDNWAYFLGLQDTIAKCNDQDVNCIVTLGGGSGAPSVSVPAPSKKSR